MELVRTSSFRCRVPFLPGETDLDQVSKIFQCMGTPTEETWPGVTKLPDYIEFKVIIDIGDEIRA